MSVETQDDIAGLSRIGRIVGLVLREMERAAAPGRTTADLDGLCAHELARHGARPSPRRVYGFPGSSCISVNDEVVHGVPGPRVLEPGDVLKIDVTADLEGYVADAARTVVVGPSDPGKDRLVECARSAFRQALHLATAGALINSLGAAVERETRRHGFNVIRELAGHGVGRAIHEPPDIPNYHDRSHCGRLTEGLVVAIEPIIAAGTGRAVLCEDGWTIRTADRSLAVHHEETVMITRGRPIVFTAT